MTDDFDNRPAEPVQVTEGMKKRNRALGLSLFALVVLIAVVSYLKIDVAMP